MDLQPLIAQVAERHKVLLTENDPIFLAVTLNELVLAEYAKQLASAVETAQRSLTASSEQQLDLAKKAAAQLVTTSGTYVSEHLVAAGKRISIELEQMLTARLVEVRAEASRAATHRKAARWFAITAATATAFGLAAHAFLT